ncbi:MAG: hypothetical protein QW292_02420 [Candidatus Parvarchaeota archaeon]
MMTSLTLKCRAEVKDLICGASFFDTGMKSRSLFRTGDELNVLGLQYFGFKKKFTPREEVACR